MRETAVVIGGAGEPLYWHLPEDRTSGSLPDSAALWDVLWEHRAVLAGVAHTHPGSGVPGPSFVDLTTFASIEKALGRRLSWWISSADRMILVSWVGPGRLDYGRRVVPDEPWVAGLRDLMVL